MFKRNKFLGYRLSAAFLLPLESARLKAFSRVQFLMAKIYYEIDREVEPVTILVRSIWQIPAYNNRNFLHLQF